MLDATPDGIVVCDSRGVLILVNSAAERMFGYGRDELCGQPLEQLIPESVRARHRHDFASYATAPRVRPMGTSLDLCARRKDGSEFPAEISLSPFAGERDTLFIAGIRDVSDRRRLERENRRTTAYLLSAMEAVQDAFLLFDERDRVIMVNSAARAMLGAVGDAAATGRTFEDLLRASIAAGVYDLGDDPAEALFARRLAYHRAPAGVLELRTCHGRSLRITERRTADRGTVTIIADITEDVQHADELRVAREAAEAASDAKSEFLSSMSHELRTPLNAILGFAQLLERDRKQPLSERQRERLSHVLRGGEHLLHLIDDVLDLARIESRRVALTFEAVAIGDVLADVMHTLAPMAAVAGVHLAPLEPPAVPRVIADRTRLTQILVNLGSNAIKYNRPDGHVSFRAEAHASSVRIRVSDDGIGIADEKRALIFEPFERAGQETGPIEGTGIGLTITKRLCEAMRGRVGFDSRLGEGSEFWVELPAHLDGKAREAEHGGGTEAAARLATGPARHRVVYVEDNASNVAFMRDLIADLPGIELSTAPDAEVGLPLIRALHPTLVIMDINLPGMSGFEAVKRLRMQPETRDIPVVGLSAAALKRDALHAREAGFARYLTKPVQVSELTEALESLLEGP